MLRFFVCILWMQLQGYEVETVVCGGVIQSHYGEITSPNYPSNYPDNQNCLWNITGPTGSRIMLHLMEIDLDCDFDFVQVYFNATQTGYMCSDSNRGKKWLTTSNSFDICFKSSLYTSSGRGFRLQWKGEGTTFLTSSNATWSKAQDMCSEEGGTMLTDDTYIELSQEDLAAQLDAANVREAWIGRYFTSWSWLKGCYTYKEGMIPGKAANLKHNQQSTCSEYCSDSNYFGLKGQTCYCFKTLEGRFSRTSDYCTDSCPGNSEERCGGNTGMTVYMNDLCFNNSTLWNGTISTTRSGETCLSWNLSGNTSLANENMGNTDFFCRDPSNKGNTWCYTGNGPEDCDIPKCLGKTDNYGAYDCMAFKEIRGYRMKAQQSNCSSTLKAMCQYPGGTAYSLKYLTWNQGRDFCRNAKRIYDGTPLYSMTDTRYVLRDAGIYYWIGYRRAVRTLSDLSASSLDCFRVTRNENDTSLTVVKCKEGSRAVCQKLPRTCGEIYEGKHGNFSFPNSTRTYDSDHNCVWGIMATSPEPIEIYIEFELEDSVVCMCDKIKIYDNDAPKGQANKTLCGRGNLTFISSGPAAVIQFISDGSVNGAGFNISWRVEKEEPTTIHSITTVFNSPASRTGLEVWLIVVISSGSVVFVLVITALICCWRRHKGPRKEVKQVNVFTNSAYTEFDKNETITTGDKMHGSPEHSDSDRLDDTIDTYATVQEPSELLSADSIIGRQRAAIISPPNDDFIHDEHNSMNATLNSAFSSQTNVYNHITKDENEYSVATAFKMAPMNNHIKGTDNVYNTLKKEEKLYDHADLSGKPNKRTENESDDTYNKLPRSPDNEYDRTCPQSLMTDNCEYNYISN